MLDDCSTLFLQPCAPLCSPPDDVAETWGLLDLVAVLTPHILEQLVTLLVNHQHSVPAPSTDSSPGKSINTNHSFCPPGLATSHCLRVA